jgi:hypothetical protein
MALEFPYTVGSFANLLRMTSIKFMLADNMESSGLGNGQVIVADLAPKFWTADVALINMGNAEAMQMQALVEALDGGLNDFYLYDPRCAYPQYDPTGSILGANTVTNSEVAGNGKQMKFSGLPAAYQIRSGDMFSFVYGPSNEYRALHRVVVGDTANGSGNTTWIEFRPRLADPSLATGKTMTLIKPNCRMKLIPNSFDGGNARQMMTTGMSFKCRQVP